MAQIAIPFRTAVSCKVKLNFIFSVSLQIKHIDTDENQGDTHHGALGDFLLQYHIGQKRNKDIPQGFQNRHVLQFHPFAHRSDIDEQRAEKDGIGCNHTPVEHGAKKTPMLLIRTLLQEQLATSRQKYARYHQYIKQSYFFHANTIKPKIMIIAPKILLRVIVSANIQ